MSLLDWSMPRVEAVYFALVREALTSARLLGVASFMQTSRLRGFNWRV
jgi:hypothetical protein